METMPPPPDRCPVCGWGLTGPGVPAICPRCALPLTGATVEELREVNRALLALDVERGRLLGRRGQLLALLRPAPALPAWGAPADPRPPGREASPRAAQNLLLSLGGVLLAVAAVAFTLVSWGHLGIGGRALVLGALTAAVVAVPALLVRRALNATGEVVGCLGLVLLLLDAYAVRRVAFADTDGLRYAAVSIGLICALWAAYGRLPLTRRLLLPAPGALLLAQLPLPLLALASGSAYWTGAALLGTAALDAAVRGRLRVMAAVLGSVTGLAGLGVALVLSLDAQGLGDAAQASALLLAGAGVALVSGLRAPGGAVAGLAAVAAFGGAVRVEVAADWAVPGYLACAVAVLYVVLMVPRLFLKGVGLGAGAVHGLALLWALPSLAAGVFGPSAAHGPASAVVVPAVLAVLAGFGPVPDRLRTAARCGAVVLGAVAAAVLPLAAGLPYVVAVLLRVAVVALLLVAARTIGDRAIRRTALGSAVVLAVTAAAWGLDDWSVSMAVFGVLLVAFAGTAAGPEADARAVGGAAAVACAAGLAWVGPSYGAAYAVLGVAAAAVGLAFVVRTVAMECAGYVTALLAVVLAASEGGLPALALVLALTGVLAGAVALRADRRPAAGYVGAALMVAATWVRLSASDITMPEAYTLPVTLAALSVGLLRRRRDPAASSSWTAYGPGLLATLLPSLIAAWTDPAWLRPLLLGLGALAVTLYGARYRLRAPLILGGAALVLDGLHELAPFVVQAVGALPRWLPLALAGALLLAVGATYEQRLRDVRRVRDLLGRLR
ncbi:SCO7613 C-terminal domain-containing membrane protein [Streptomyces sp. NBC_01262]|uniref:SCO7613 C-terminal domain-containing membrane protein n=1 Tax=Streptomyces sp. NBC_01262 TaxID=2903803 RepID=UPI002E316F7A|nr:hypothetical protein [Streptomyces sp. NBC_01262]